MREISHHPRAGTGTERHAAGSRISAHVHDDDQIIYVTVGVLAVTTSRGTWSATPERAVMIPAGVWHEHRVYGLSRVHVLGLGKRDNSGEASTNPTVIPVSGLIRELIVALTNGSLDEDAAQLATSLLLQTASAQQGHAVYLPRPIDARLAEACSLVEEHLDRSLPLPILARQTGSTERTLSRLFRAEFGMTYPQWRSVVRVFHATVFLAEGGTATDVAARCGWITPSAFSETFRNLTGQTPTAFQQSVRQHAGAPPSIPMRESSMAELL